MSVEGVREGLKQSKGFWPALHRSLDRFGFDEEYVQAFSRPFRKPTF
jgi:hypothetical protein